MNNETEQNIDTSAAEATQESPPGDATTSDYIKECKYYRAALDLVRSSLGGSGRMSRERDLACTKIQEAIMWLGMDMRALNDGRSCYPEGMNPANDIVEPVPDGVHGNA